MFNFLNNYNKFLFSSSVGGDENSEDQVNTKRSALKTAGKNLVQKTKQLGSLAKENITGITFASSGTALTGFGISQMVDEMTKTRTSVFSDKANKFHEFYNANKEILGIPGVDSFLSGTNKDLILNFLNLKDQSLINTLLNNQSLFTNNNALSLFQNDSFLNLINPNNLESLNLLSDNIGLFSGSLFNTAFMNTIMGNESLQTLLNNDGFKNLLNDEKFLNLLQDPEGLNKFFQGAQQLVDDKYLNVLNDPVLSGIFKNQEIQNLLTNPEMLAMLKNPEFFALFSDPNIAPLLTNPDFQALLIGKPDLIKNLLSNPDILKLLNTPEALQMLQNPQLATLLQNQVSSDAFFEMLKNPEMLGNILKSNDLTNYLEASANIGVSTGAMAGIIISILVGVILTGVGIKMFTAYKENDKLNMMRKSRNEQEPQKKTFLKNLLEKLSNLFSKVFSFFKKDKITSKDSEEVNLKFTETLISLGNDEITFKENFSIKIRESFNLNVEKNQDLDSEKLSYEIARFIKTYNSAIKNSDSVKNVIQNNVQTLLSSEKNMNEKDTKDFFLELINSSIEIFNNEIQKRIGENALPNDFPTNEKITLEDIQVVKAPEKSITMNDDD